MNNIGLVVAAIPYIFPISVLVGFVIIHLAAEKVSAARGG